jgi:hypothetical protein
VPDGAAPKGQIAAPGLVRGRIVPETRGAGHVAAPGLVRGKLAGPMIKQPERPA